MDDISFFYLINLKGTKMKKLNKKQISEIKSEIIETGVPVRFMDNGKSLDILSGDTTKRGTNIMYQIVYWKFSKETSKKIANWLGVKVIFSE